MIKIGDIETLYVDLAHKPGLKSNSHMYYCINDSSSKRFLVCTSNPNRLVQSGTLKPNDYKSYKPNPNLSFKKTTAIITSEIFEISGVTFFAIPFINCNSIISDLLSEIKHPSHYLLDTGIHLLLNPKKLKT